MFTIIIIILLLIAIVGLLTFGPSFWDHAGEICTFVFCAVWYLALLAGGGFLFYLYPEVGIVIASGIGCLLACGAIGWAFEFIGKAYRKRYPAKPPKAPKPTTLAELSKRYK